MYWHSYDYEKMAQLVIDVYIDYNITKFPIDEKELCRKIGITLVPYSAYDDIKSSIALSDLSNDAFYLPASKENGPIILYNDKIDSEGRIHFSIFHDTKHFLNGDKEQSQYNEDIADFFARYLMYPIPVLINRGVNNITTIISDYNVSAESASYVLRNLQNRRAIHGNKIFDFEKPLIALFKNSEGGDLF